MKILPSIKFVIYTIRNDQQRKTPPTPPLTTTLTTLTATLTATLIATIATR